MRRNEEREAALDAILNDYRETCQRITETAFDRAVFLAKHKAARAKARSEIFRVMRRDRKPSLTGKE